MLQEEGSLPREMVLPSDNLLQIFFLFNTFKGQLESLLKSSSPTEPPIATELGAVIEALKENEVVPFLSTELPSHLKGLFSVRVKVHFDHFNHQCKLVLVAVIQRCHCVSHTLVLRIQHRILSQQLLYLPYSTRSVTKTLVSLLCSTRC